MSDAGGRQDVSSRTLALTVRLLPSHLIRVGTAMQAELASLDDVRARRHYELGCTRAVFSDRSAMRTVAGHLVALTFGAVALAFAISIRVVGVRIQTIAFVLVLEAITWSGRGNGALGPVAEHPLARRIRNTG